MFIITVTGNILAQDKMHFAQDWVCGGSGQSIIDNSWNYDYDLHNHTVRGNLLLNKNIRSVPYAIYYSQNEISASLSGEIYAAPGALAAVLCYKDNIGEIEELIDTIIPAKVEDYFYNGLLTGIFSILELFLSDVLLCLIFNNQVIYDRALNYLRDKKVKLDNKDIDLVIKKYFTERIVYHKFDEIRILFKAIIQIELPETRIIHSYLPKRNNITHRFAFSNIDRMRKTIIDPDILHCLINNCNKFVEELMKEIGI